MKTKTFFITVVFSFLFWGSVTVHGDTLTVTPNLDQYPYVVLLTEVYDDQGNPRTTLSQNDFSLAEAGSVDGELQPIEIDCFTSSFTVSGIAFSLVCDVSASMNSILDETKAAINSFIELCNGNDKGALVTFSSGGTETIVMSLDIVDQDTDQNGVRDMIDSVNTTMPRRCRICLQFTAISMRILPVI